MQLPFSEAGPLGVRPPLSLIWVIHSATLRILPEESLSAPHSWNSNNLLFFHLLTCPNRDRAGLVYTALWSSQMEAGDKCHRAEGSGPCVRCPRPPPDRREEAQGRNKLRMKQSGRNLQRNGGRAKGGGGGKNHPESQNRQHLQGPQTGAKAETRKFSSWSHQSEQTEKSRRGSCPRRGRPKVATIRSK